MDDNTKTLNVTSEDDGAVDMEGAAMSERLAATWSIALWSACPACGEDVDLLEADDFWGGRSLDIGEHQTDRSRGVEVRCPECDHEYEVDLVY
jgi:predicted RNA-binding Zn-ribbon protein involved in translation (DUF1610 family)